MQAFALVIAHGTEFGAAAISLGKGFPSLRPQYADERVSAFLADLTGFGTPLIALSGRRDLSKVLG